MRCMVDGTQSAEGISTGNGALEDGELVARVVKGDREAFHVLYRKYVKKVYSLVRRIAGGRADAEELTQEVFYQVYRNLPRFRGDSSFYTWLYRVAINTTYQWLRKENKRGMDVSFEEMTDNAPLAVSDSPLRGPEQEADKRMMQRRLMEAIARLPENQREVMVLGPLQGHSYEEMARILGVSVTVIKGRLHRAREKLRSMFPDFFDDA